MIGIKLFSYISKYYYLSFFLLITNYIFSNEIVKAQIIPDGTLDTKVELINQQNIITGGQEAGKNLFHSFEEFSPLPDIETYFKNNPNIENIFSRVTSNNPSFINGIIKTNDASLFLINPSGIIFGNNARLDINGSFFATTAEQVIFADGTTFNTKVSNVKPLLTVSMPIGLQYGIDPGEIVSNGISRLEPLKERGIIALLGGEVSLQSTLISEGLGVTEIEIVGIGKEEIITLNNSNGKWKFDYSNVTNFKDINIGNDVFIDSGGESTNINIQGDNIVINSSYFVNSNNTNNEGGNISLKAKNSIRVSQSVLSTQSGASSTEPELIELPVKGNGGNISLNAQRVIITNGSLVTTSNFSEGKSGNINIEAKEYLEISGVGKFPSAIDGSANPVVNNVLPSSIGVTVGPTGTGGGGNINIKTNKFNISDGGRIDSSTTGRGNAGTISIEAKSLEISNVGRTGIIDPLTDTIKPDSLSITPSSIAANVGPTAIGNGGNIQLITEDLNLINGGRIDSSTNGAGNAGIININAIKSIFISGKNGELYSGLYASSEDKFSNQKGDIVTGNSGDLNITVSQLFLQEGGRISVENAEQKNPRNAGNITINTDILVLFDDSKIIARAEEGNGGDITINTKGLFPVDAVEKKQIDAATNSDLGIDGEIKITDPDIHAKINTNLQERKPIATENLIYGGCGLNSDFIANKFRYIGRGGISPSPLTVISKDLVGTLGTIEYIQEQEEVTTEAQKSLVAPSLPNLKDNSLSQGKLASEKAEPHTTIQEAIGWTINDRGNIELIARSQNIRTVNVQCPMSE